MTNLVPVGFKMSVEIPDLKDLFILVSALSSRHTGDSNLRPQRSGVRRSNKVAS